MGKTGGFLKIGRQDSPKRPVGERVRDFREVELTAPEQTLRDQGARCMGCGVPFCHGGCPLGNVIPDWNDLVYRGRWREAAERLHATNNFPEVTGRICPAPCEEACVLNINDDPVTIRGIERAVAERAFEEGLAPVVAKRSTGKRVAVVGSGPAGMAAAQQLARAGHAVVLFERSDRIGGLLRYGIPDFKLEKGTLDRRLDQMQAEGVELRVGVDVGVDVTAESLRRDFDAVVLSGGATKARELPLPGRSLNGVHLAMDFLVAQNRVVAGLSSGGISAAGKRVVVLGGGDTGADCVGTAARQGAASIQQIELLPRPPEERTGDMPWPWWPMTLRTSTSHDEGAQREWSILTKGFAGESRVVGLDVVRLAWEVGPEGRRMREVEGSEHRIDADLVLLALGFVGPERGPLLDGLGVELDGRGAVRADRRYQTSAERVYACGDMRRGQSLVVWAIWEGREAARCVDEDLMGRTSLPTSPGPLGPAPV